MGKISQNQAFRNCIEKFSIGLIFSDERPCPFNIEQNIMKKTQRQRKKRTAPIGTSRAKGDLVEQIVAKMHEMSGVTVQQNVFLPVQDSSDRQREIDILLTSTLVGYPIQLAIECKNEKEPTGVEHIDGFVGKLHDVGIPTQLGIFVTASRYTDGAVIRAKKAGIRPLVLQDSNLPKAVLEAFQSLIYLLLAITRIEIDNDVPDSTSNAEVLYFQNDKGQICGSIPDLVWQEWRNEKIEPKIGKFKLRLSIPSGWLQIVKGHVANVYRIETELQVFGYVVTYSGEVRKFLLTNASDAIVEKHHLRVTFPKPEGAFPIAQFVTEEELAQFIHTTRGIRLSIGRFRVPRIVYQSIYWPISEKTAQKLYNMSVQEWQKGQEPDFSKYSLEDIEGADLAAAWEPIWQEHPLARE